MRKAIFSNLSTDVVQVGRFRLGFRSCDTGALISASCMLPVPIKECINSDVYSVLNVTDTFEISVVQKLVLLNNTRNPGIEEGRDLRISTLPRILSGTALGDLVVQTSNKNDGKVNSFANISVSLKGLSSAW